MLTRRRRLIGVSCVGRFILPPPLVSGNGHVISKMWTSLTVVLSDALLTEAISGEDVAAAMVSCMVVEEHKREELALGYFFLARRESLQLEVVPFHLLNFT